MIFGDRIKQIRELKGLTQTELAALLDVSQSFVAQLERGMSQPSEGILAALAFKLGFPPSFFEVQPSDDFPLGSLLFRAPKSMTERELKEVYRWAQTAYGLYLRIARGRPIREVELHIPRCQGLLPEDAAEIARSELGMSPDTPVPNLINTLEKAGVFFLSLPREFPSRDAFSLWGIGSNDRRRPIVVLTARQPADRLRMTVAHELGHLVMHQPLTIGVGNVEDQAKKFASSFLLPRLAMLGEIKQPVSLDSLLDLKVKWGVSVQALVVRAHELEIITPRMYRTLYGSIVGRGWRTREPLSRNVPLERPRAFRQIAETFYGNPPNYKRIAADSDMSESFVRDLFLPYAGSPRGAEIKEEAHPRRSGTLLTFRDTKE